MGLDMCLNIHTRWYEYDDGVLVKKPHPGTDVSNVKTARVVHEVYWRKANQIHNWFVENVQDGEDDCKEYGVSTSDIENLLATCKRLIDEVCKVDKYLYLDEKQPNNRRFHDFNDDDEVENPEKKIPINSDLLTNDVVYQYNYKLTEKQAVVADDILPTRDGFFFGTTEYNGIYIVDVLDTIEKLEEVLNSDYLYLTYRSSW